VGVKIKVLADTVINQIAAGEVVERPASVVRELVDNAVDAGATDIFVALESGGHSRIRVRDNGCGMGRDEAVLAFERHATSKVSSIEDLTHLSTLGFRGEALASIAAVSKVKLTTRARESDVGVQVTLRGGKLVNVQSIAWSEGTEIEIEHLFFNTPARRKFLKSPRSEVSRIRTWLANSSLARPSIRYRLVSDGDELLNLSAVATRAARGKQTFPPELISLSLTEGGIHVEGMVAHPGQALSDSSGLVILINGRLVSDKIIVRAVREGYDSMLKDREFPIGYIVVDLPAEDVDVNVHPQKSEVRFRRSDQVFAVVRGAVLAAVRNIRRPMSMAPVGQTEAPLSVIPAQSSDFFFSEPRVAAPVPEFPRPESAEIVDRRPFGAVPAATSAMHQPSFFSSSAAVHSPHRKPFCFSDLRYVGQVLECYLVCELDEKLVVVDMHAAHERVNYNKIRKARADHKLAVQSLLIPEVVRLTSEQVTHLMEQSDLLRELAFEVEELDHEQVAVRGVPSVLSRLNCASLIKEFAAEPVPAGWRERLEERIDHIAARLACHASVRSGDLLARHEAYALFAELDEAELSGACPHGRPVVTEFSRDAVERWFGRDR
jgi:DNA mismatch repair protein MutL